MIKCNKWSQVLLAGAFILSLSTAALSEENWPVVKLSFSIKEKSGWTPKKASVPVGAEVQLSLKNDSNATACFEIAAKKPDKFLNKGPICLSPGESEKETFFANVDKGSYIIRNRQEQQPGGELIVK